MAISRGLSTLAMSVSACDDSHFGRPRSVSRSESQSSSDSIHSPHRGMPIHIRRPAYAPPPPLPPPRYIEDLERHDIGYELANSEHRNSSSLPPIPEGSSLRGGTSTRPGHMQPYKTPVDDDEESRRRLSGPTMLRLAHSEGGVGAHASKMTRRVPSPPNSSTRLHGELPLVHQSHDRSNRNYDHAMLSKIGKPNSPPRHSQADSDSPILGQKLSVQTKDMKGQRPSPSELTSTIGTVTQWITSPTSTGASPGIRHGWHNHGGLRSPPLEHGSSAVVLDPELFVQSRPTHLSSTNGGQPGQHDLPTRSARNSSDQTAHTPAGSEIIEAPKPRGLDIEESHNQRRASGTGLKRKALSPPGERQSEDRMRVDQHSIRPRGASKSPHTNYPSQSGSLSSTVSSIQPPSYSSSGPFSASSAPFSASSAPFSATAGSVTSMSSFDPNSPRDQSLQSYMPSTQPLVSSISNMSSGNHQEKHAPHKLSLQTALSPRPTPTRIGNSYLCACCPKKPKKFETEEQLRAHEMEKQYSCNFCHNRFKNKNEAERHQNSLHLRRHSWSCAALANFQAAFSPSGAIDSSSTATDACGYCGEEFPNLPLPDWEARLDHLTNVHKFGECNTAKKFFRADHFRQHLKHSHAGRSGKWTNILEHACVRDEIPPEPVGFSVSPGDHTSVTSRQVLDS